MKPAGRIRRSHPPPARLRGRPTAAHAREIAKLQSRLAGAEEALSAIRSGEVDGLVVTGQRGPRVFTLQGAEHAYRLLIEAMNEGALTLTVDKLILFANQRFARLVKYPLEQVTGSSFRRFLSPADRARLRPLMRRAAKTGSKIQVMLQAGDNSLVPVQLSIRELARSGTDQVIIGMVVTDMTEARRIEEMLRALTHRVVQVQETERGRVALELHDHITQLLCAIVFRSQALVARLSKRDGPAKREAGRLRRMLAEATDEVDRISQTLRPGVLDQLGLDALLRTTGEKFSERTGVPVRLACAPMAERLPADTELALFRIFEEALKNVELHAHARHVGVSLSRPGAMVTMVITDDGVGFDTSHQTAQQRHLSELGLLGMRERAAHAGGVLTVRSGLRAGTEIEARIPLPVRTVAAKHAGRAA